MDIKGMEVGLFLRGRIQEEDKKDNILRAMKVVWTFGRKDGLGLRSTLSGKHLKNEGEESKTPIPPIPLHSKRLLKIQP